MNALKHLGVIGALAHLAALAVAFYFRDVFFYNGATSLLDGPWELLLALYAIIMLLIALGYYGALWFSREINKQTISGHPASSRMKALQHVAFISAMAGVLFLVGFIRDSYKHRSFTFPVVGCAALLFIVAYCLALWMDNKINQRSLCIRQP